MTVSCPLDDESRVPETAPPEPAMRQAHPWLKPLRRRVATLAFCCAWLGFEAWHEPGSLWFWLMVCVTGYALWDFFLSGTYSEE